jgi:hypothetical protein
MRAGAPYAVLAALSVLAPGGVALAAETASDTAPPEAQQIASVERGGFLETDFGLAFLVNEVDGRSYGPGALLGIYAGYDFLPILSVMLGVQAMVGTGDDTLAGPRGDLVWLSPMLHAQLAILTTERNFLWARAGAGFGFAMPDELGGAAFGGAGPVFSAGIGYERFTKLRHFSIGARAGLEVVTKPAVGIGISILPTLKYTF